LLRSESINGKDGLYHAHSWWKVMCKDRCLGYNEYEGANGIIYALNSTAELSVAELNTFMDEEENFFTSYDEAMESFK